MSPITPPVPPAGDPAREPIRGSSLLVMGRIVSLSVMCAVQVLAVRYLSRGDYGAWTYALSVVTVLQSVAALGLDRSITRFVSIYHERRDYPKLRGAVLLMLAVVTILGTMLVAAFQIVPGVIASTAHMDPAAVSLLAIVIVLVPLEALDVLLIGLFASLGRARAIFVRKHVLGPALKLATVFALVALEADVRFLAYGWVAATALGMILYLPLVLRATRELGMWGGDGARRFITVPAREVFTFTMPLLTADFAGAVMWGTGAIALGYYSDLEQVALFTAAMPLAALNEAVMRNFALLYTPTVSRLFARHDRAAINDVYWRMAGWTAVLTFPIFVLTFSAAGTLMPFLFGEKYRDAGAILALLALGEYVNVAFGLNGLTLRLLDKVRYCVAINVTGAVVTIVANVLLVPRYGALGAAWGTAGAVLLHTVLKQAGLAMSTGVRVFDPRYASLYGAIGVSAGAVALGRWLTLGHPVPMFTLAAAASVLLAVFSGRTLMVSETFPEVRRVPLLRTLFT